MSRLETCSAALAIALLTTVPCQAQNLVVNGDFEGGNQDFTSGYDFVPFPMQVINTSEYTLTADPATSHPTAAPYGDNTSGAGLMMMINGATVEGLPIWTQTVAVDPGTDYEFSFFLSSWIAGDLAVVSLISAELNDLGTATASAVAGVWEGHSFGFNSGPNATLTFSLVNLNTMAGFNDFAMDDISLREPIAPTVRHQRGDANCSMSVDTSDAITILNYLFLGGAPPCCLAAFDTLGLGEIRLASPIYLLLHLFLGGPPPPSPYPDCGDGTASDSSLGCDSSCV